MFAEGFHGNCVNCDAGRQRQRLYYCGGPFVFSLNVSEQLYFLTDTLSLCSNLFRFLVWSFVFPPFFPPLSFPWLYWGGQMRCKNNNENVVVFFFFFFNMGLLECHYLNWLIFLLVAMMQLEMEEEGTKKNSTPTSFSFLVFVEYFYCSGRTNSGHCSLALGEFWMLVSSQNNGLMLFIDTSLNTG